MLIANSLAAVVEEVFALYFTTMDAFTAWAGALLYAGQIYYDFAGYSDMAIGLGLLFGFRLPENFNFPYASRSIREFWRRWHITLGAWFRDYLYIPLGGSRGGRWRTARNLLLVFLATGFWHGAAWAFVLERQAWWRIRGVWYALPVVVLGWVIFRTESFTLSLQYYRAMFGFTMDPARFDWAFYWSAELSVISTVAIIGSFPLFIQSISRACKSTFYQLGLQSVYEALYVGTLLLLFVLCTSDLAVSTLNPFIYFRF